MLAEVMNGTFIRFQFVFELFLFCIRLEPLFCKIHNLIMINVRHGSPFALQVSQILIEKEIVLLWIIYHPQHYGLLQKCVYEGAISFIEM